MKKLLVLGATGGTGRAAVEQALAAGHQVTAFVRTPATLRLRHERLRLEVGTLDGNAAPLAQATNGHDVVVSALGRGLSLQSDHLFERVTPALISAMTSTGVRRLIVVSAIGVAAAYGDAPLYSRMMIRVLLKDLYADKLIAENLIRDSDLDWTIVQPAQLTNGPLTGRYHAGERTPWRLIPRISRADVAHFILRQVDDASFIRKVVRLNY
jgi:putative NADH-flavin reductase